LGNLAVGHVEHGVLDLLERPVHTDRIDDALQAGAGGVLRIALGQVAEIARLGGVGGRLGPQLLRLLQVVNGDQPDADHRAVQRLELAGQVFAADRQPLAGQLPQGQRRPNYIVGVLGRRDVPLLLEHL
jgi:hypothetical protein